MFARNSCPKGPSTRGLSYKKPVEYIIWNNVVYFSDLKWDYKWNDGQLK